MENARRLEDRRDMKMYPLSLEAYQTLEEQQEADAAQFKGLFKDEILGAEVMTTSIDATDFAENEDQAQLDHYEDLMKSLKKDIYVKEALNIMQDVVELHK